MKALVAARAPSWKMLRCASKVTDISDGACCLDPSFDSRELAEGAEICLSMIAVEDFRFNGKGDGINYEVRSRLTAQYDVNYQLE